MTKKYNTKFYVIANIMIFILCFITILIVDMFVNYSSGDDVSHQIMANRYNLWNFIRNCETSRISKKISLYFVMRSSILTWRIVNAFIFTLFIGVISKIVFIVKQVSNLKKQFFIRFILLISMCFAHISITGFTIFWVTGTQDYLWPLTFGILSLIPEIQCIYGKNIKLSQFLVAVICALWGGLGQEQISLMLICVSALIYMRRGGIYFLKSDKTFSLCLLLIRIFCFLFLLLAPMNQIRMSESSYYTGFNKLTLLEHLFITVQWELSAFANEMKSLFIFIWIILGIEYFFSKQKKKFCLTMVLISATVPSFLGTAFLNTLGISRLTDIGILVLDIVKATDNTVSFDTMSIQNWFSFIWWMTSTAIITPYLLRTKKDCCYLYILGLLLPLMMIVSSSMYVSGGRVFWVSAVLFSSVIGMLLTEQLIEPRLFMISCCAVIFGIYEIIIDSIYFINNLIR